MPIVIQKDDLPTQNKLRYHVIVTTRRWTSDHSSFELETYKSDWQRLRNAKRFAVSLSEQLGENEEFINASIYDRKKGEI